MKNKQQHQKRQANQALQYTVQESSELLPFLLSVLSSRSRNSVKSVLRRGQVSVNNKVETAHNCQLKPGQTVKVQKDKSFKQSPLTGLTILHEDDDLIVVEKEAGLLSMASPKEKNRTAHKYLMDHVRLQNPGNRVFIVHRLDRDTSGVMMFAKNEHTKHKLQNAWTDKVKERTYVALVEGKVKKREGKVSSWLKESKTLKMYSSPKEGDGEHAVTHYKVLQSSPSYTLLEIHLETGKKNQIRVHMEDLGHPIAGDKKYGAKGKGIGRLGLHARVLAFYHPTTGKFLRFETKTPSIFLSKSK
ncbi:RluA family pseudouridine synthase [Thalassobacillus sp. CUG 92003]|uniref:RluA family pseudouridine synthase n=1 Tax=Thalassobacillus sp. CUG 92003 TaxID=2736641 RepID=UPI0015E69E11|nr:RluA family pseudouridine synthase [Thalassobacillus sp. CUG 92003]